MKCLMRWEMLVSMLAAATAAAAPGGTIRGTVYVDGKEPLPEARVQVVGTELIATTNAEGQFEIANVPPAKQSLKVSADGYADATLSVEVVDGQAISTVADLKLDGRFGEEIVVTGSRFGEKRLESAVTVETIQGKTLQFIGGHSPMAALSLLKGVDYADVGINEKQISTRGFNAYFKSRTITLVDGRLAQTPGTAMSLGFQLPTPSLDLKAIDVVVGPASALYGPNAHSGVVHFITKSPWDESGVSAELRGGTQAYLDGAARVAGILRQDFAFKLNAQYSRGTDFAPSRDLETHYYGGTRFPRIYEGDLIDNYNFDAARLEGFLYYRKGGWDFKGGYGFSQTSGLTINSVGRSHVRGRQIHYQTLSATHPNWFAQFTHTSIDNGNTYSVNSLADLVQANGGAPEDPTTLEPLRQQIGLIDYARMFDSDLQYHNELGDLRLIAGLQLRVYRPNSQGTTLADGDGNTLSSAEFGGYVQGDYKLLRDKLRLVGALRVDTSTYYGQQLSPKASLVFSPAASQHLRLSYNRAYKNPSLNETFLLWSNKFQVGNRTGFIIKDADGNVLSEINPLIPEEVDSVELGYKATFFNQLLVDVVAYHSWYDQFISGLLRRADPTQGTFGFYADGTPVAEGLPAQGNLFTYSNYGRARVAGADVGFTYSVLPELSVDGSVSYIKLLSFKDTGPGTPALLLNVPELKFKSAVTLQNLPLRNSFLRVAGRYQQPYTFQNGRWDSALFFEDGRVPARFVMDLNAGYTFSSGLTLSGNVFNLLDDKGVDILGAPQGGRLAYLQLSYKYDGLNF